MRIVDHRIVRELQQIDLAREYLENALDDGFSPGSVCEVTGSKLHSIGRRLVKLGRRIRTETKQAEQLTKEHNVR